MFFMFILTCFIYEVVGFWYHIFFFWSVHLKHNIVQSLKAKCFFLSLTRLGFLFLVVTLSLTMVYFLNVSYKISFPEIMLGKVLTYFFLNFSALVAFQECLWRAGALSAVGRVVGGICTTSTTALVILLVKLNGI